MDVEDACLYCSQVVRDGCVRPRLSKASSADFDVLLQPSLLLR
jgi:hypothetical protein